MGSMFSIFRFWYSGINISVKSIPCLIVGYAVPRDMYSIYITCDVTSLEVPSRISMSVVLSGELVCLLPATSLVALFPSLKQI